MLGQVVRGFMSIERLERQPNRQSLSKSRCFRLVQDVQEARQSHKDNLKGSAILGFQVSQQAKLFQQVRIQVLRFIHHQDSAPAGFVGLE